MRLTIGAVECRDMRQMMLSDDDDNDDGFAVKGSCVVSS